MRRVGRPHGCDAIAVGEIPWWWRGGSGDSGGESEQSGEFSKRRYISQDEEILVEGSETEIDPEIENSEIDILE